MAAARLNEYVNILFLFEPGNSGSRPGIVFTVDEYHFRVVLLQESLNLLTECLVKRHIFQFLGKHQAMQVAFAGLDGEILFERTGVVAVIAQFACGLYEERGVGTVGCEIGRVADGQQVGYEFCVGGCG